jgi:hypothetical protein
MIERKYTEEDLELRIKEEILLLYQKIFKIIWERLIFTLGMFTPYALFKRIIKKNQSRYPFLKLITLSDEGISLKQIKLTTIKNRKIEEIKEGFNLLISELFSFIVLMTGDFIVEELEKIIERYVKEIEKY